MNLKENSSVTSKTARTDGITSYRIPKLSKKLSPCDLQWLVHQLGNLSDNDNRESKNINSRIPPSPELMDRLDAAVDKHEGQTYRYLMDQTDWNLASADVLDRAIGIALSFGDMKRGKALTELGLSRLPEHEQIARTWLLFNPRPARVIKKTAQRPVNWFTDSMEWIKQHVNEYEIGHWLAVRPGELIADAPTRDELDKKLSVLPEDKKPYLVYKVIP